MFAVATISHARETPRPALFRRYAPMVARTEGRHAPPVRLTAERHRQYDDDCDARVSGPPTGLTTLYMGATPRGGLTDWAANLPGRFISKLLIVNKRFTC